MVTLLHNQSVFNTQIRTVLLLHIMADIDETGEEEEMIANYNNLTCKEELCRGVKNKDTLIG